MMIIFLCYCVFLNRVLIIFACGISCLGFWSKNGDSEIQQRLVDGVAIYVVPVNASTIKA